METSFVPTETYRVAIVHDYLTQRGGAERVVLAMARAFPEAEIYTSLYSPEKTYSEFRDLKVHTSKLQYAPIVRKHHRAGALFYPQIFARMEIDADVVICSSSGWSHFVEGPFRKLIYCYTPARWLYLSDMYLREAPPAWRIASRVLSMFASRDRVAAGSADAILTSSSTVRGRIREVWGQEAAIVPPPLGVEASGPLTPLSDVEPGFALVVSRLLSYKNVDAAIMAAGMCRVPLVVVGDGPDASRLRSIAPSTTVFVPKVSEGELRWLYANAKLLIAASNEDFGLTPLEANAFGKPVCALRWGGFLDTIVEGVTGLYFDSPDAVEIARVLTQAADRDWDEEAICAHAATYSEAQFAERLRSHCDELGLGRSRARYRDAIGVNATR